MSELVTQRAVDFLGVINQARVQRNKFVPIISTACRSLQTGIPFDANVGSNSFGA
jgi:hypothetical protein